MGPQLLQLLHQVGLLRWQHLGDHVLDRDFLRDRLRTFPRVAGHHGHREAQLLQVKDRVLGGRLDRVGDGGHRVDGIVHHDDDRRPTLHREPVGVLAERAEVEATLARVTQ